MSIEYVSANLPTEHGLAKIHVFKGNALGETYREHCAIDFRSTDEKELESAKGKSIYCRVHSECLTGDVFASLKCDCGKQLEYSLSLCQKNSGIVVYLRQEGRGIGLFDKIRSYKQQEAGADTYDANVNIGHQPDARDYKAAALMLNALGVQSIVLITNNREKVTQLQQYGIQIERQHSTPRFESDFNKEYLDTKVSKFKHRFD